MELYFVLVDFFIRELIGYRLGRNLDAKFVYKSFANAKTIKVFHTDRGSKIKKFQYKKLKNNLI